MAHGWEETVQYLKNIQGASQKYDSFIRGFLLRMALKCLRRTKQLTPVDDGQLRNSWQISEVMREGEELYVIIHTVGCDYASFVEDGHWQRSRFLPIYYLDNGSTKGRQMAADIRAKYGADAKGVKLRDKWIPGYHMARISLNEIEDELPRQYQIELQRFLKSMGVM